MTNYDEKWSKTHKILVPVEFPKVPSENERRNSKIFLSSHVEFLLFLPLEHRDIFWQDDFFLVQLLRTTVDWYLDILSWYSALQLQRSYVPVFASTIPRMVLRIDFLMS